jgi:hypothetical protein
MRTVRFSKSFARSFDAKLAESEERFGVEVATRKRAVVMRTITSTLARFPGVKRPDVDLELVIYPIAQTPWSILYDFDDQELRVHVVVYSAQSLDDFDPASVEW